MTKEVARITREGNLLLNGTLKESTSLGESRLNVNTDTVSDKSFREGRTIAGMSDINMAQYDKHARGDGYASIRQSTNLAPKDNDPVGMFTSRGTVGYGTKKVMTPYGEGVMITATDSKHTGANTISAHYAFFDKTVNIASGNVMTFSAWCYMSADWDGGDHMIHTEQLQSGSARYDMTKRCTWQQMTIRITGAKSGNLRCLIYNELNNKVKGHIILSDIRLTVEDNITMHNVGLSSYNDYKLFFKLHHDHGIDFTKDWSFSYWKKPISSHANNKLGYSIDSVGYSQTFYAYWGKDNNANKLVGHSTNFNPDDYWGEWRLIVLTHSSDGFYVTEHGKDGTFKRKLGNKFTSSSQCVSSNIGNADLQLGGWQANDRTTSLFRHCKVGKVKLSDSDIETMYKEGLRIDTNSISINGNYIEGSL